MLPATRNPRPPGQRAIKGELPHRVDGLDAWRTALLMCGLLLHGAVLKEERIAFEIVRLVSSLFRMGAFFAISGMLAGLTLRRKLPTRWLVDQTRRIGIPALFGITIVSPLIWLMLTSGPAGGHAADLLPFDWHHLWFLAALLVFHPLAYASVSMVDRRTIVRSLRLLRSVGQAPLLMMLGTLSLLLMSLTMVMIVMLTPERYWPMLSQVRFVAGYAPLYLLGMALARSRALRRVMFRDMRGPAVILALAAVAFFAWYAAGPLIQDPEFETHDALLRMVGSAICPPAAALLILRSALAVKQVPAYVHRLCGASFTIYVLHYPMLIAINLLAAGIQWNPYLEYALAIAIAGSASYAIHVRLVATSPLWSLLLNGRAPRAAGPARLPAAPAAVSP